MRSHLIREFYSRPKTQPKGAYKSPRVASLSAKITETLEQFDAQLLAALRVLEILGADHGHARHSTPGQECREIKNPSNELAPVSPAETSLIQWPSISRSVEDVSDEQNTENSAPN